MIVGETLRNGIVAVTTAMTFVLAGCAQPSERASASGEHPNVYMDCTLNEPRIVGKDRMTIESSVKRSVDGVRGPVSIGEVVLRAVPSGGLTDSPRNLLDKLLNEDGFRKNPVNNGHKDGLFGDRVTIGGTYELQAPEGQKTSQAEKTEKSVLSVPFALHRGHHKEYSLFAVTWSETKGRIWLASCGDINISGATVTYDPPSSGTYSTTALPNK